jgi:hypothetical protein
VAEAQTVADMTAGVDTAAVAAAAVVDTVVAVDTRQVGQVGTAVVVAVAAVFVLAAGAEGRTPTGPLWEQPVQ